MDKVLDLRKVLDLHPLEALYVPLGVVFKRQWLTCRKLK